MKLNRTLFTLCLLTAPLVATAQIASVTGYGKHVIDPVTKVKSALYTFKLEPLQKGRTLGLFFLGNAPSEAQFYYEAIYKDVSEEDKTPPIVVGSPSGWAGETADMMESNQYAIHWGCRELVYCLKAGQSSDKFTVKLPKADPAYVSAYYTFGEYYGPANHDRVIPFDTIAPRFDFSVVTYASGRNAASPRTDWTEVVVTPTISDNYDPYPVSLLDSVTSSDASFVASSDVEVGNGVANGAANGTTFCDEVLSFWSKNSPNRQYVVKYTGMDASGNKTKVSKTIWAP